MSHCSIDPAQFVALVQPPLKAQDVDGLIALLHRYWTPQQITELLTCSHPDARKVAALALALVGEKHCVEGLVAQLKDPDPVINEVAEHALWSVWFRSGTPEANQELARGAECLNARKFACAEEHFARAIQLDPHFAEPYNQRAISFYLQEQYEPSIENCRKAVELMPCHFGAWAGMGHCHAHLGQLSQAIRCYRTALEINPHLQCVSEAVEALTRRVQTQ